MTGVLLGCCLIAAVVFAAAGAGGNQTFEMIGFVLFVAFCGLSGLARHYSR